MNAPTQQPSAPAAAEQLQPSSAQPSARLRALMRYAKSGQGDFSFAAVQQVLAELYHPKMSLADSMHHLVAAYQEALQEPRYEMGAGPNPMLALVLAPVQGLSSIEVLGPVSLDTSYTVRQFYDAIASKIFGNLSVTRVDWLQEPLTAKPSTDLLAGLEAHVRSL